MEGKGWKWKDRIGWKGWSGREQEKGEGKKVIENMEGEAKEVKGMVVNVCAATLYMYSASRPIIRAFYLSSEANIPVWSSEMF